MEGRIFQWNYVYTSSAKPNDILKPERALVKFVLLQYRVQHLQSCYYNACSRVKTNGLRECSVLKCDIL